MSYQELAQLKESREYKAAEALTDAMNTMGWNWWKVAYSMTSTYLSFSVWNWSVLAARSRLKNGSER